MASYHNQISKFFDVMLKVVLANVCSKMFDVSKMLTTTCVLSNSPLINPLDIL